MLYAIPAGLTTNGYTVSPNKVLSALDKDFMRRLYPHPSTGCWVDLFEDEDFDEGDLHTRISGPVQFSEMTNVNGSDFGDKIDSLRVGPEAVMRAY